MMRETTRRLAFVHVPKTAGTSVTETLVARFGAATCPAMTTLDYREYTQGQLADYRFYKGHAYRRDYTRLPPGTIRFTVLRDPVARALSYWRYYRGLDEAASDNPYVHEAIRLARTQSCIEFVYSDSPFVIEHLRLGQIRQFLPDNLLATIGHRQFLARDTKRAVMAAFDQEMATFDYALTVENLALSLPLMLHELGLRRPRTGHSNASAGEDKVDRADLRRALIDVNGAEFECYEAVRARETAWLADRLIPRLDCPPLEAAAAAA